LPHKMKKMTQKNKRILSLILMAIPTFVLIMGGTMKIIGAEPASVMAFLNKAGFGPYITILGVAELLIAAVYILPKTQRIGFLLASSYYSGALAMEISGAQPPVSIVFILLLWISMFLKNKTMFLQSSSNREAIPE
jgi:hypothetical protein